MGIGKKIHQSHLRFSLINMALILQHILSQCKFGGNLNQFSLFFFKIARVNDNRIDQNLTQL